MYLPDQRARCRRRVSPRPTSPARSSSISTPPAITRSPLPHMLPPAAEFAERMSALGLDDADDIVVYDGSGANLSAARVWWMFRSFGHDRVAVLDGGIRKWQQRGAAGRERAVHALAGQLTVRRRRTVRCATCEQVRRRCRGRRTDRGHALGGTLRRNRARAAGRPARRAHPRQPQSSLQRAGRCGRHGAARGSLRRRIAAAGIDPRSTRHRHLRLGGERLCVHPRASPAGPRSPGAV